MVVDGMCGVGGNAVHFARRCSHAIGLDCSASRLALAAHNAALYGVRSRLDLLCADFLQPLPRMQVCDISKAVHVQGRLGLCHRGIYWVDEGPVNLEHMGTHADFVHHEVLKVPAAVPWDAL